MIKKEKIGRRRAERKKLKQSGTEIAQKKKEKYIQCTKMEKRRSTEKSIQQKGRNRRNFQKTSRKNGRRKREEGVERKCKQKRLEASLYKFIRKYKNKRRKRGRDLAKKREDEGYRMGRKRKDLVSNKENEGKENREQIKFLWRLGDMNYKEKFY